MNRIIGILMDFNRSGMNRIVGIVGILGILIGMGCLV